MAEAYPLIPQKIKRVNTPFRKMNSDLFPIPKSIPTLEKLRKYEPRSMTGQPPIVWDRAEGVNIYDKYGNKWLDWSCGVLVASAGHSNPEIVKAIVTQAKKKLLHNYCFPSEVRAKLVEKIISLTPKELNKVFLLTTGAETVEVFIKLSRYHGIKVGGTKKIGIVSFTGAFHGRTLGAQTIGGSPGLKEWIINLDPAMYNMPFPHCYRCPWGKPAYQNCDGECFNNFLKELEKRNITSDMLAGVITETYQGGSAAMLPKGFVKLLSDYCRKNQIILCFDEVQAGFGRTGTLFGFEHYGVIPDLFTCGKAITSSLPLSAIIGRGEIMDIPAPNTMTSTHTGNPICIMASLANINYIVRKKLWKNAAKVGSQMKKELENLCRKHSDVLGHVDGVGLVFGLHVVKPGTKDPDGSLASVIAGKVISKGLCIFAPVGVGSGTIKIAPPLTITLPAVKDGCQALDEAISEAKGMKG